MDAQKKTVYNVKKRVEEGKGNVDQKKGPGRKPTVVIRCNIDLVRKRVQRNPRKSMRGMAKDMNSSDSSKRNIVRNLGVKSVRIHVVHNIMPGQQTKRLERTRRLLEWREQLNNASKVILWSDEKLFYVEQHLN